MHASSPPESPQNDLLKVLREEDRACLQPFLKEGELRAGDVLYHAGDHVKMVYFPRGSALLSYVVELTDGRSVETVLVGREGAVGGIVSHGHLPSYARCEVQFSGPALMIGLDDLERAKSQSAGLRNLFNRYADCLVAQIFQSVACNAVHTIEQRAAKWLIATIERTGECDVPLTQEQLASMLGVGRSYVSRVIGRLRAKGIMRTRRGRMEIRSSEALRALSCDCDDQVREHFDQILQGVYVPEAEAEICGG